MQCSMLASLVLSSVSRVGGEESRKTAVRVLILLLCEMNDSNTKWLDSQTMEIVLKGVLECSKSHWCPEVRAACLHGLAKVSLFDLKPTSIRSLLSSMKKENHGPTLEAQLVLFRFKIQTFNMVYHDQMTDITNELLAVLVAQGVQTRTELCTSPGVMASAIRLVGWLLGNSPSHSNNLINIREWFFQLIEQIHGDVEVRHAVADALSYSRVLIVTKVKMTEMNQTNQTTEEIQIPKQYISCWNVLLRLLQDDDVNVRISARRTACILMGGKEEIDTEGKEKKGKAKEEVTLMLGSRCLRQAYQHVCNVCVQTNWGQNNLMEYIRQKFAVVISQLKKCVEQDILEKDQNQKTNTNTSNTKMGSKNNIKVFDDERENFFTESILEIEILEKMFRQLVTKAGKQWFQFWCAGCSEPKCQEHCGELLKMVVNVLNVSEKESIRYGNENRFSGIYGTLLYLSCMCSFSNKAKETMQSIIVSNGLVVPANAPAVIANAVERLKIEISGGDVGVNDGIFRLNID